MKRVVAFFDMFDEIPENAKYLFSNKFEFPIPESEEEKTHRIISSNPQELENHKAIIFIHYYEVDAIDFEELMETKFIKTSNIDKMKNFMQQYKIPSK